MSKNLTKEQLNNLSIIVAADAQGIYAPKPVIDPLLERRLVTVMRKANKDGHYLTHATKRGRSICLANAREEKSKEKETTMSEFKIETVPMPSGQICELLKPYVEELEDNLN